MSFDFKRMLKYERNLSLKERQYRLYAGVAMIVVSVFTASILLLLLGMFCVAEWHFKWCPLYAGLNKNTYEGDEACSSGCSHGEH
ncbi:MAG: DUF2892 domain-containing protein [Methylococcaceae bacterium]